MTERTEHEVTTETTTTPVPPPAQAEPAEDEAPELDTTLRGSRVFAAIGGETRYHSLKDGCERATPEPLKAACRADEQARQAALAPPLPPLPPRRDAAMGRFESAHTAEGARMDPWDPPGTGSPVRTASRLRGVLGRLRRPARPRPEYMLAAPALTAEPAPAEVTAADGMPRIPPYLAHHKHRRLT